MNHDDNMNHDDDIIVNLIPPAYPTAARYKTGGIIRYNPISYIAITKSGRLRPVGMWDDELSFLDDFDNYEGLTELHREDVWMTLDEFKSFHVGLSYVRE